MAACSQDEILDWLHGIAGGKIDLLVNNDDLAQAAIELIHLMSGPVEPLPEGYLTPHFTLAELTYSDTANAMGIDNTPDAKQIENLTRLCKVLEQVRSICGSDEVSVTSGYRCPELNAAVGGVSDSAHLYGLAADIVIPAFGDPTMVCNEIMPYLDELQIDQLIDESNSQGDRWVHVGLCEGEPRCECFQV